MMSLYIVSYHIALLFLKVRVLYHGASIVIPDDMSRGTISKENDSFTIFQDHYYNKLQRSKMDENSMEIRIVS